MAAGLLVIRMEPVAAAFVVIWKQLVAAMGMAVGAMSHNMPQAFPYGSRGYEPQKEFAVVRRYGQDYY